MNSYAKVHPLQCQNTKALFNESECVGSTCCDWVVNLPMEEVVQYLMTGYLLLVS